MQPADIRKPVVVREPYAVKVARTVLRGGYSRNTMSLPSTLTTHSAAATADKPTWAQTLKVYLEPASLRMLSLGFSAGLPLLLVFGTLSFWLREAGVDRSTIGFLSWVGLAYGFKWVWSPLVDRCPSPC